MKLPKLKIGDLVAKIPIIQGGMAVRVSTAPLAAAVANEGAIGLIAGSGMEIKELKAEIRKAKNLSDGIIGVNIMVAVRKFKELLNASVEEGIDLVVAGAGFSRDMFEICKEKGVEIVPIVSSPKLAKISEKLGASAVVVEGKEAGGHLGTDEPMKELLAKIKDKVQIPIIAAGGIVNGKNIAEAIKLGADAVQMGSRFVASKECEVAEDFKQLYIDSNRESSVLIDSPVGLPGRALKNEFFDRLENDKVTTGEFCEHYCLKKCSHSFCVMDSLIKAQEGDMEKGLVFAGEKAHLIENILSVKDIISNLVKEANEFLTEEDGDE